MKKYWQIIIAFIIIVLLTVVWIQTCQTSNKQKEEFRKAQSASDYEPVEEVEWFEEPSSGDVVRYHDNNGYESEMRMTEDGATFKDNNGYESTITVE